MKELNAGLQQKINAHVCTIVVHLDSKDPTDKLTRVMTKLKISEDEIGKIQMNLDDTKEKLKHKERQLNMAKENASQYHKNYLTTCDEIKELKGNMSLIQAREIIWNDIIQ